VIHLGSYLTKFSDETKKKTVKAIRLLADNPKHRSLQVHQIKGTDFWEAYVNDDIRLVFKRNSDTYVLYSVGHHDILRKF
jgi:mRNA-degrading endonuclease YafQ of YafQ-DinJ toxin-antitoxin module